MGISVVSAGAIASRPRGRAIRVIDLAFDLTTILRHGGPRKRKPDRSNETELDNSSASVVSGLADRVGQARRIGRSTGRHFSCDVFGPRRIPPSAGNHGSEAPASPPARRGLCMCADPGQGVRAPAIARAGVGQLATARGSAPEVRTSASGWLPSKCADDAVALGELINRPAIEALLVSCRAAA